MRQDSPEFYNIKTRIGTLLFDFSLDETFCSARAPLLSNRHNHAAHEVHFIVAGTGKLLLDRKEIALLPGHFYFIPAGKYHAIRSDGQEPLRKYTIRLHNAESPESPESDWFYPAGEVESIKQALSGISFFCAVDEDANNIRLLEQVNRELEARQVGYYGKLQSLLNLVLIHVIRAYEPEPRQFHYRIPRRSGSDRRSLVIEQYFDRFRAELSLQGLATELQLSTRQTNRILRKMYHTSFRQKLTDIRMEESIDLLKRRDIPIEHIAERLGYSAPGRFSAEFKTTYGCTPSAYRALHVADRPDTRP